MRFWGSLSGHYRRFLATTAARRELDKLVARGAVPSTTASALIEASHLRKFPRDHVDDRLPGLAAAVQEEPGSSTAWALLWFLLEVDLIDLFNRRTRDLAVQPADLEGHIAVALLAAIREGHGVARVALLDAVTVGLRVDSSWRRRRWLLTGVVPTWHDAATEAALNVEAARLAQLPRAEQEAVLAMLAVGANRSAASRALGISRHHLTQHLLRALRRLHQVREAA